MGFMELMELKLTQSQQMHYYKMFCVTASYVVAKSVTDIKTKEIVLTLDLGKPRHGCWFL